MRRGPARTSAQRGRPFFIFGSGRSGTSLLSRMLNQHPHLAVPPESHLYSTFHPWLGWYGSLALPQNRAHLVADMLASGPLRDWSPRLRPEEVLPRIDGDGFAAVVDAVMHAWAAKQGKRRWGEKTPRHLRNWREISGDFAASPVIHVVRDGRDVAVSMIKARFGPKSVYACARAWKEDLDQIEELENHQSPSLFYQISYEEILQDSEQALKKICNFLGEEYAPEMLSYHCNTLPYPTDARNQQNLAKPVMVENKEKWRHEMTRDDVRVFEAVAGDALARYGYARAIEEPALTKGEEAYRRYVEAPWRRSLGRLKDRKGQGERLILVGLLSRRVGQAAVRRLVGGASASGRLRLGLKDSAK
ncbi:MAG TPA: sulfotransferase [Geminicoccaceae bacterium]|nr:sulfotransferase [Geminicoccaceae bacterium]